MLEIRSIQQSDYKNVNAFRDFICELIDENAYLLINKKPTMSEEKTWLKDKIKAINVSREVCVAVWNNKKLVGICDAKKGKWKDEQNTCIGIAILKKYRGQGLGEKLLRDIIKLAKKKLNPKNIYLTVAAPNKPAINLYKKIGFRTFARFPKWSNHDGKYIDNLWMLLKK